MRSGTANTAGASRRKLPVPARSTASASSARKSPPDRLACRRGVALAREGPRGLAAFGRRAEVFGLDLRPGRALALTRRAGFGPRAATLAGFLAFVVKVGLVRFLATRLAAFADFRDF